MILLLDLTVRQLENINAPLRTLYAQIDTSVPDSSAGGAILEYLEHGRGRSICGVRAKILGG